MGESRWTLRADSSQAKAGLEQAAAGFDKVGQAQARTRSTGEKLAVAFTGINQALELGKKLIGVVQQAWAGFDRLVLGTARDVAKLGDDLQETARAFGVGTDFLQGWRASMAEAGVETATADRALLNIQKSALAAASGAGETAELFARVGIEVRGAGGEIKTADVLARELADAFQSGMIPASEQAAVSAKLLMDRTGKVVLGLKEGSSAIDENMERLREWGTLMSGDLLASASAYDDSIRHLTEAKLGLKNAIAEGLLPTMAAWNEAVATSIGENTKLRAFLVDLGETVGPGVVHVLAEVVRGTGMFVMSIGQDFAEVGWYADAMSVAVIQAMMKLLDVLQTVAERVGAEGIAAKMGEGIDSLSHSLAKNIAQLQADEATLIGMAVSQKAWNDEIDKTIDNFDLLLARGPLPSAGGGGGGEAPSGGAGEEEAIIAGGSVIDLGLDKVEQLREGVATATEEMRVNFDGVATSIGGMVAELATSQDKTEVLKTGVKSLLTAMIQSIGQYATQALSSRAAIAAANVAAAAAETAAQTPAAITGAISTYGANVVAGSAAIAAGVALMTGLLSAIGDAGIPPGMLGDGKHTVLRMGGQERLLGPGATRDVDEMLRMQRSEMAASMDGRAYTGAGAGRSRETVVNSSVYLDGELIAEVVSRHQERRTMLRLPPFSQWAMEGV